MSLRPGMGKAKYSCPSRECSGLIPCSVTSPGKAFSLSRERGTWILECVDLSVELRTTRNLSSLVWVAVFQCCRRSGWWCREHCPCPALGREPGTCHLWSPGFVPLSVRDSCWQKHLLALKQMLQPEQKHWVITLRVINNRCLPIFNFHQQWMV